MVTVTTTMISWALFLLICAAVKAANLENYQSNVKTAGGRVEGLQPPRNAFRNDGWDRYLSNKWGQPRGLDEDQTKPNFRLLSQSYSYAGPENILVTVTYTPDERKSWGSGNRDDNSRWGGYDFQRRLDEGVIPTPASLPRELNRAYAIHKNYKAKKGNAYDYANSGQQINPIIHQGYSQTKT